MKLFGNTFMYVLHTNTSTIQQASFVYIFFSFYYHTKKANRNCNESHSEEDVNIKKKLMCLHYFYKEVIFSKQEQFRFFKK